MLTQNIQLNVKYAVKSHVQSYVYLNAFKYASYLSYNPRRCDPSTLFINKAPF